MLSVRPLSLQNEVCIFYGDDIFIVSSVIFFDISFCFFLISDTDLSGTDSGGFRMQRHDGGGGSIKAV